MLYRNFATQEELDAQYNLYNTVPDVTVYSDFYAAETDKVLAELKHTLNVPYGPTLDEHVDVYPADADGPAPVLLYIHGGYWRARTSGEFGFVARGPVSEGVATVSVNYSLCPKVKLAEIVRQVRASVAWAYENAESFGGDRDRIHVAGHSAGGHLAATLLMTDWPGDYGLPRDIIKSATCISGLFDLGPFPYTFMQPQLQFTWEEVRLYSPLFHIPKEAPPLLLAYGGEEPEEMKRQSDEFLAAWKESGLSGGRMVLDGKNHYDVIDGFLDAESELCSAILGRIRAA
ncbi:alpha/beta hydrolase [Rubrobacter indicoceani]|uniref:alpha/beta hydrolase n=1 Tax=Rubrobacter indicoceani TaxID=2051957 RepID=UPI000E5BE602|nr:alpha/beta hydrolase [Rubrobacter indicoceani]